MDKKQVVNALFFPFLFIAVLWAIKFIELFSGASFSHLGITPRTTEGLIGIVAAPFVHGDVAHLSSNTIPLLILGTTLFYFYRGIALQVFLWILLMTGIWVWCAARGGATHIGASGVLYGLVCFLFFSGLLRGDRNMLTISLLVAFLYGGIIWGIFPLERGISWESHLLGSVAGLITAVYFRKEGPLAEKHEWPEEEGPDDPEAEWKQFPRED